MTDSSDQQREALLARCATIGTSTWSDAMDALGIHGVVEGLERRSGEGRFVGFATTARHAWGKYGDFDRADFAVGKLVAATGPGKVLMIDVGGMRISTFGGIASLAASKQNATAVVIDGACRDLDEIRATGLNMVSRHLAPTTGKGRLCLKDMGAPVNIGGVIVREGDLVIGDDTGLVVIPIDRIDDVLAAAKTALEIDEKVEQGVRSGMTFAQSAAAASYISEKT